MQQSSSAADRDVTQVELSEGFPENRLVVIGKFKLILIQSVIFFFETKKDEDDIKPLYMLDVEFAKLMKIKP